MGLVPSLRRPFVWALALNALLFAIKVLSGTIKFDIPGAYGQPSSGFIEFSDPLLRQILAWLYGLLPAINWYSWLMLAGIFLALCLITGCLLQEKGPLFLFAAFVFPLLFSADLYQLMQFRLFKRCLRHFFGSSRFAA